VFVSTFGICHLSLLHCWSLPLLCDSFFLFFTLRHVIPLTPFINHAFATEETDSMEKSTAADPESGRDGISHWKLILDQGIVTHEVANYDYEGSGTEDDPYVVEWMEKDSRNPMTWSQTRKWVSCICMAFAVLVVSFCSSAYAGGMHPMSSN
jgi:hypothetical protein